MNDEKLPPEINDFLETNFLRQKNLSSAIYLCFFAFGVFLVFFKTYRIIGTLVGLFLLFFVYLILRYLPKKQVVKTDFTISREAYDRLKALSGDTERRRERQKKFIILLSVVILIVIMVALYNLYNLNINRSNMFFALALVLAGLLFTHYFKLREIQKMYLNLIEHSEISDETT